MAEKGCENKIYGRLDTIFCDADFGVRNAVERSDFTGDFAGWWKMEIGRGERNYFLAKDGMLFSGGRTASFDNKAATKRNTRAASGKTPV